MVTTPQSARIQTTRRMTPTMMRPSKAMNSIVPHIFEVLSCLVVVVVEGVWRRGAGKGVEDEFDGEQKSGEGGSSLYTGLVGALP